MTYSNLQELNKIETPYGTIILWSRDCEKSDGTKFVEYETFLTYGGMETYDFTSKNLVTVLKRFGKYIEKLNKRSGIKNYINAPQYIG